MYTEDHLTHDMLKLAGAAGLIGITNNEGEDLGIRKQASDTFDAIASLHPQDMGDAFVKVAFDLYADDELEEVLAGYHLEPTFEKVASIINLGEMDAYSLEKVASENGSSATAAKAVAHELSDAASNVAAVIDDKKEVAESRPDGAVMSGGENVNNLEGYNPLLNPEEYDIERTAYAQIEDALMVKEASFQSYLSAQRVLDYYNF